jgi:hypothetical protein
VKPQATLYYKQLPRISVFSGDQVKDADFDQWRYEVQCIRKKNLTEDDQLEVIRRSLKGEAATIARNLGPQAGVVTLLQKFQSLFGGVDRQETRMSLFYSAKQKETESVSSWCCRLEVLLTRALEQSSDRFSERRKDEMMRSMLWSGLQPTLKNLTAHKFDQCTDLTHLLVAIREIEQDQDRTTDRSAKRKETVKMTDTNTAEPPWVKEIGKLTSMVQQLSTDVKTLKEGHHRGQGQYGQRSIRGQWNTPQAQVRGRGFYRDPTEGTQPPVGSNDRENLQAEEDTRYTPQCWRCGQFGHVQYGCRVKIDHLKKPLNSQRPVGRGRP